MCLKWYINVLEATGKKVKKDFDTIKKVAATLEEILYEISLVTNEAEPVTFKQELPIQKLFK